MSSCKDFALWAWTVAYAGCLARWMQALAAGYMLTWQTQWYLQAAYANAPSHKIPQNLKQAATVKGSRLTIAKLHSGLVGMHMQQHASDKSARSGALARCTPALLLLGCNACHWHMHQQSAPCADTHPVWSNMMYAQHQSGAMAPSQLQRQ